MKSFHVHSSISLFTSVMILCALAFPAVAEQPAVSPQPQLESKKSPAPLRVRPQVIYHVSKADAAALHAQAKSQNDVLAVDGNMPTSLQISRNAANEAAAKAASSPPPPVSPSVPVEKSDSPKNLRKHSSVRVKQRIRTKNSPSQKSQGPNSHKK
jgi:hypothetical protein